MQRKFVGFDNSPETTRLTGVPATFFTQLLPQITHPNELKTLLYVMYLAGQKRGDPKWVGYWELSESEDLLAGMRRGGDPRPPIEHLREALELCLARGSLIRVEAAPPPPDFFGNSPVKGELEPVSVTWFLLNTASNREFLTRLERGELQIEETNLLLGVDLWDRPLPEVAASASEGPRNPGLPEIRQWQQKQRWKIHSARPDIYSLYEQNIGSLTPILSERLREAASLYPTEWVEEAFAEAVNYNRRSWAYVARILENWAADGRERQERDRARPKPESSDRAANRERTGGNGRAAVGRDGKITPATAPTPDSATGGLATPGQSRRPIDFLKYTSGKYAYLTQPAETDPPPSRASSTRPEQ